MQDSQAHVRRRTRAARALRACRKRLTNELSALGKQLTLLLGLGPVGGWGEARVARYLERHGFYLVSRNWRSRRYEADIVAISGRTLVIVEVKTRHLSLAEHFPAYEAITPDKIRALRSLCSTFERLQGPLIRKFAIREIRVDVAEVYYERSSFGFLRLRALEVSTLAG